MSGKLRQNNWAWGTGVVHVWRHALSLTLMWPSLLSNSKKKKPIEQFSQQLPVYSETRKQKL